MTYRIDFKPSARRQLKKLPREAQARIVRRIEALAHEPRPPGSEVISGGEDLYRIRIGDYRVIYKIQDRVLLILVVRIGHRRGVYRRL